MQTLRDPTRTVWRSRLKAALRTVVACTIVGTTTLYSPATVRHLLAYPAFSYVTTILIVSDATAGDTFRGLWHVACASVQVLLLSVLAMWLIGPGKFTPGLAATAVAVTSFVVAVPESTHLTSKRIAFGQIVIVYVGTIIQGATTHVVMHPVHVALSTALGAIASVIALLLPYPRLACSEVRKTCRMYIENATERLNLYLDALSSGDTAAAAELITRAAFSCKIGGRLLTSMKDYEDGMLWERPDIRFLRPPYTSLEERFQEVELPLRGMELALKSCSSFPVLAIDQDELRNNILPHQKTVVRQKLEQAKCFPPFDAMTAPESKDDSAEKSLYTAAARAIPDSLEDLPALFFLFCVKLLRRELPVSPLNQPSSPAKRKFDTKQVIANIKPTNKSLIFALKCSVSLGLAVLLGLMYNRENGYWSGLTIAISFVRERQPTFTVANARAQGTAMGSVYGILCFFIFERFMDLRLFALLPWIVFASFLRHSRMYGQAGGISAVIGALLILGRKNYGTPPDFAIARITEATIGLICFIMVELVFEPARAGTLARIEMCRSFGEAKECIKAIAPCRYEKAEFRERMNRLKARVLGYERHTKEAEVEPNFWFSPFPASCYLKLLESLSMTTNLLRFLALEMETLQQLCQNAGFFQWKDVSDPLKDDVELLTERLGSAFDCLEKVTSFKTVLEVEKELKKKTKLDDIEMGKPGAAGKPPSLTPSSCIIEKEEVEKIAGSFLSRLNGVIERIYAHEGEEEDEVKNQMALCLGGFGFCINKLMREMAVIQDTVKELIAIQNPSCRVDLCEISCKVEALRS